MTNDNDRKNDSSRLLISAFIVATTLTVVSFDFAVPSFMRALTGAFLLGLFTTACLAFLFILAKGYELRYNKIDDNFIDKHNYILYNSAMSAFIVISALGAISYTYEFLSNAINDESRLAAYGYWIIFIAAVMILNNKDIRIIVSQLRNNKSE